MTEPVLRVKDLNKSYGALKVSDDITLDLKAGEIHALIGPNGAGKSSFIKQIAGGLMPDSGHIYFLGRDVTAKNTVQRARLGLGRTFQISALAMEFSVLQNVVLGSLGAKGKVLRFFKPALQDKDLLAVGFNALERVGLQDLAAMRTAELSHGQRRQLEVAVALTLAPKAFLMDEPMAGLGASGSKRLIGFLDELRDEAPILLVEHDMDAVFALADRISVLVYGKIIITGSVEEVRADPEVRSAYLGEECAA